MEILRRNGLTSVTGPPCKGVVPCSITQTSGFCSMSITDVLTMTLVSHLCAYAVTVTKNRRAVISQVTRVTTTWPHRVRTCSWKEF